MVRRTVEEEENLTNFSIWQELAQELSQENLELKARVSELEQRLARRGSSARSSRRPRVAVEWLGIGRFAAWIGSKTRGRARKWASDKQRLVDETAPASDGLVEPRRAGFEDQLGHRADAAPVRA
jgi:hypothetical protein